eukprot:CAMPEP_0114604112 /NCGR_PEP_ID=MMETSP0168-20121206/378_1 /TAXON_ID=95228 ORGANISM="Vannella sp., Strain DIVA3 517/6/12" /NCGR_SAMPLE_ID=MMETSP0168 /ASSEMBLY_ACC=CAM_ASM_000044 /LENGTH=169 /DNA_ID=CAMNT_0001814935 /DNA_START=94 /DNA_END=603 /DNA_ORIENTATION=-
MITTVLSSLMVMLQSDDVTMAAPFFGFMGVTSALVFACMGAAYGTAKSGVGIAAMGVLHPDLVMRSMIPVIMAGVVGIYGLIIAVIVGSSIGEDYTSFQGFAHLGAGLSVGLSGLAAGMAIGIVGDSGVRATAQQPKLFVGVILILIFSEALGLYGLIVALIVQGKGSS